MKIIVLTCDADLYRPETITCLCSRLPSHRFRARWVPLSCSIPYTPTCSTFLLLAILSCFRFIRALDTVSHLCAVASLFQGLKLILSM
jgi:hypothetical protein